MATSIIKEKSYDFALQIIKLCTKLEEKKHHEIANQLLRSGTGIGANVEEALAGQSRKRLLRKNVYSLKRGQRNKLLVAFDKRFRNFR